MNFQGSFNTNMYVLSFYVFMHCTSTADCRQANDMIRVSVRQAVKEDIDQVEIKYSDLDVTPMWKQFSVRVGNVNTMPRVNRQKDLFNAS